MKTFDKDVVAKRIKYLRTKAVLSQEQLAEKLGMKRTNLSNYEAGRVIPPSNILFTLAEVFSVTTDFILGRDCHELVNPIKSENELLRKTLSEIKQICEERVN